MPALLRAAAAAAEMNQRHSLLGLSKDGVSVEAFEAMGKKVDADGKLDAGATARAHLAAARDFFVEGVTPDKAAMLAAVSLAGADEGESALLPAIFTGAVGAIGDAVEAVPAVAVSLAYAISAAAYGAVELVDGD